MNDTPEKGRDGTPPTVRKHDRKRAAYRDASTARREARRLLTAALDDPERRPETLLAPTGRPWRARGVTGAFALRVLDAADAHYLAGYSRLDAGAWTRSAAGTGLPLTRHLAKVLGLDERAGSSRARVGAALGYLDALGVFAYGAGQGGRYSTLAYGTATLGALEAAVARQSAPAVEESAPAIPGGVPNSRVQGVPNSRVLNTRSIRGEHSPRHANASANARPEQAERRGTSTPKANPAGNGTRPVEGTRANTGSGSGPRPGSRALDALYAHLDRPGTARIARRLDAQGYRKHGGLRAALAAVEEAADRHGVTVERAVSRLRLGTETNLDAAESVPAVLAKVVRERGVAAVEEVAAAERAAAAVPVVERPDASAWSPPPAEVRERVAALGLGRPTGTAPVEVEPVPAEVVAELAALAERRAAAANAAGAATPEPVAVGGSEYARGSAEVWAAATAEVGPVYTLDDPLRSRVVAETVAPSPRLTGPEAAAAFLPLLDRRRRGEPVTTADLAALETTLGRPLRVREVALLDLTLRVEREPWERSVERAYAPDLAALPPSPGIPVEVVGPYGGGAAGSAVPDPAPTLDPSRNLAGTAVP